MKKKEKKLREIIPTSPTSTFVSTEPSTLLTADAGQPENE
jgi:hypothetical protein